MTIAGWIIFVFMAVCFVVLAVGTILCAESLAARITVPILCGVATIWRHSQRTAGYGGSTKRYRQWP